MVTIKRYLQFQDKIMAEFKNSMPNEWKIPYGNVKVHKIN